MTVKYERTHFLYCPIAEQYYYAMEQVHEEEGLIVSFTMEAPPAGKVTVHPRKKLVKPVSPRLRGCLICGSNMSCSCDCLQKNLQCEKRVGYRFQCLYCKHLQMVTAEGK